MPDPRGLVELLRKLPRGERYEALTEKPLVRVAKENAMFDEMRSPASNIAFHGGLPDHKARGVGGFGMVPRSRLRYSVFDTARPNADGYATDVGSIATNMGKTKSGYLPEDLIDVDLLKEMRRQGYGKEILANVLSNAKDENARVPLWDVKRSAKDYWEGLGAQMKDPSRPFVQKDKRVYDKKNFGLYDPERSVERNNDYYITPGDFLENLKACGGLARYADGGQPQPDPRTPLYAMPNSGSEASSFRNLDLASIEGGVAPKYARRGGFIRRAGGGSIQQQNEQFGPRAAALMRINSNLQKSRNGMVYSGMPEAMTSRLGALRQPMLSAYSKPYASSLDPSLTPMGEYGRGYARGGVVRLADGGTPSFKKYLSPLEDSPMKGSRDRYIEDAMGWGTENFGPDLRLNGDQYGIFDPEKVSSYLASGTPATPGVPGEGGWEGTPAEGYGDFTDFTMDQLKSYLGKKNDEYMAAGNPGNDAMWLPKYVNYGGKDFVEYGQRNSKNSDWTNMLGDAFGFAAGFGIPMGMAAAAGSAAAGAGGLAAEGAGLPSVWGSSLPYGSTELGIAGTGSNLANIATKLGPKLPGIAQGIDNFTSGAGAPSGSTGSGSGSGSGVASNTSSSGAGPRGLSGLPGLPSFARGGMADPDWALQLDNDRDTGFWGGAPLSLARGGRIENFRARTYH